MESTGLWNITGSKGHIYAAFKTRSDMKVFQETGIEANIGFGRALMPCYLGMCPQKA